MCFICRISGSFTRFLYWCSPGSNRSSICRLPLNATPMPPAIWLTRPSGCLINCSALSRGWWFSSARWIDNNRVHNVTTLVPLEIHVQAGINHSNLSLSPQMLDEGVLTSSFVLEEALSPYDVQSPDESVLRDHNLLSCFKKDAHKMETFLKLLKCRQGDKLSCLFH